jgi:hypothetical protein
MNFALKANAELEGKYRTIRQVVLVVMATTDHIPDDGLCSQTLTMTTSAPLLPHQPLSKNDFSLAEALRRVGVVIGCRSRGGRLVSGGPRTN